MSSKQANSNGDSQRSQKTRPTAVSNSFNPPLAKQPPPPPLPAIKKQPNEQTNTGPSNIISNGISSTALPLPTDEIDLALPTKVFKAKKTAINDLSQAVCSYLWFRRFKEIFLLMGNPNDPFSRFDMELARNDMIQTCDQYLESERPKGGGVDLDQKAQATLDRWKNRKLYAETFRMSYFRNDTDSDDKTVKTLTQTELSGGEVPHFDNAIWWYSCNEAPIYDQMNNILRLESFELLMCHRYYISHLCQMIERWYTQNKSSQKVLVYRADRLSGPDFQVLEKSVEQKDATISINGFISTSRSEKISLEYAEAKLKKKGEDVIIMYEITIDPSIPCTAYADIESISFHPREREVLFNMGSTFLINAIQDDPTNPLIKRIKLTAKDFNLTIVDEMKAKIKQASQPTLSLLLVRYLIELGEDRVSKRYLNQIIESKQLENDSNLVSVYNCLGMIHYRQALYGQALDNYRKALNTQARIQFSNNNALAEIFNNIGQTHLGLNQLDEAQKNLEEGIRIQEREPKHARQHLASLYCNMGRVAYARHDYDEAEKHYKLSYDLYNRSTKISHDALEKRLLKADLCIAYGQLKSVQDPKNTIEANEKFEEALEIYNSTLPASHPKVAETRIDIICEYARNKNFESVINSYDEDVIQLLEDYETKQTTSQQDLANLYAIIGACFAHEQQFDKAMEIWKKSIQHEQKSFLDQLLSSARISKINPPIRLLDNAYRAALDHYSKISSVSPEHLAILYTSAFMYDQAIDHLRGQNSYLLANLCVLQRKFKGTMIVFKRLLNLKNPDLTCMIGILLRILTAKKGISNEEPIIELLHIEKLLVNKISDHEVIRLRMIINDYLAEAYLSMKKYEDALRCCQTSYNLKQRHYSSNHPSLVRTCLLFASCSVQREDYKNALQHYEKAIEIQLDNMPSDHPDIRSNYFLMGDCYCKMDKMELANEYYERAQASNDTETDDNEEIEPDTKALIRMHSNLSKVLAKRKDFSSASTHQREQIDLLKQLCPTYIIDLIEDENAVSMTVEDIQIRLLDRLGLTNGKTFAQVLQNFISINICLARASVPNDERTEKDEDATDLYEQAIELQLKLSMFEKPESKRLQILYEELSNAYAKLYTSMKESVQENLIKALEETTDSHHQRSLEYRLGNLCFEEKNYSEADRFWKQALKKVEDTQPVMRTIVEKLIEKNKDNLSNSDDESDNDNDTDQGEDEETPANDDANESQSRRQSVKSQRRQSVKSVNEKGKPEELAQAYLDLEDYDNALKYFKKYAIIAESALKASWPEITTDNEHLPMIKFFHSLLLQHISSTTNDIPNKDAWLNLLQTYVKIFKLAVQLDQSVNEIAKANQAVYQISQNLYNLPQNLITLYDLLLSDDLKNIQWNQLFDLLSLDEAINILMKIAAYYISDGDHDKALEIYWALQNATYNQPILRSAISYRVLKVFEVDLQADDDYSENIMSIDVHSSVIPVFDRIILCRLLISYWNELDDEERVNELKRDLLKLQTEPWTIDDLETIKCIGHVITKIGDNSVAHLYWNDLRELHNEMLPDTIVKLLYSSKSTFEEIYRATQDMNNELSDNIIALAETYEALAVYEENDDCDEDACEALKKTIIIYSKDSSKKGKVEELKTKMNKLQNE